MLINLPYKFIDKFYGKTSEEIDMIITEALEAYFSPDKVETQASNPLEDFKSDLALRLLMEVADKVDKLGVTVVTQEAPKPVPVVKEVKVLTPDDIEIDSSVEVGDDDLNDFLLDICK